MSAVSADISMSLDGYVTGPDPNLTNGLGTGGEPIQQWVFNSHDSPEDRVYLEKAGSGVGAVVMGRRTFDFVDGPHGWDDEISYAYDHTVTTQPPVFVLTHTVPHQTRHPAGFTFVTGGISEVVAAARREAGDKETVIMGGANTIAQALSAGLVEELRIHLSPVLMGGGTRLFDMIDDPLLLTQTEAVATPNATHLTYRVR
ncbi:dihydrofolate reductase [Cellulosimicrobium funkei]|nr:dihydrofolate reductase [Cellulosimicrobium funkei]